MEVNHSCYATAETFLEEHEHVLKMCCRIRKGLGNDIETDRLRSYAEWFQKTYLEPHFEIEENYVFPILGSNARVKKALANHRRIKRLLSCSCEDLKVLNLLEEELAAHVRFEERTLYKEFSEVAGAPQLQKLEQINDSFKAGDEEWEDKFWLE